MRLKIESKKVLKALLPVKISLYRETNAPNNLARSKILPHLHRCLRIFPTLLFREVLNIG